MRTAVLATFLSLLAAGAMPARAEPKDDVGSGIDKLAAARSFAWTSRIQNRASTETEEGVEEKGGYAVSSKTFNQAAGVVRIEIVRQGTKAVMNWDQGWQTFDEAVQAAGGGRARATVVEMLRNEKPFTAFARELLANTRGIKKVGDAYEGELTESGAKSMLEATSAQVQVSRATGTARFRLKDGVLSGVDFHLEASVKLNGRDRPINSTAAADVKDVGTAKAQVPDEAKQKLAGQQEVPF